MKIKRDVAFKMYKDMLKIRHFEEAADRGTFTLSNLPGNCHPGCRDNQGRAGCYQRVNED